MLAEAGYVQYEVSAYARAGRRCRHNLNYWLFGDYVGIGAGAHGKLSFELPQGILRTTKPKQPRDYQEQVRHGRRRPLAIASFIAVADLPFEFMLNALRLNEGFTVADSTGVGPGSMLAVDRAEAGAGEGPRAVGAAEPLAGVLPNLGGAS